MKPNKSHHSRIPTIGITNTHGSIVIHWYYAITELGQNSVSACQMRVKVQPGLPCLSAGAFFVAWILSGPVSAHNPLRCLDTAPLTSCIKVSVQRSDRA